MATTGVKVGNLDVQFGQAWDPVKANQIVQSLQQTIGAVNRLANLASTTPDDTTVPEHVLATEEGLGPSHTVSGLEAGQVLIATSPTSAEFAFLKFSQLAQVDANSFADASNGDVIQFIDGYWSAAPSSSGGLGLADPGANAIVMWNEGTGKFAWALPGTGISLPAGQIGVNDTQLTHGHLLGLLADDHPQYALVIDTPLLGAANLFTAVNTFQLGLILGSDLDLAGNIEQTGLEGLEWRAQLTDDTANEGTWRAHEESGQWIFASVSDPDAGYVLGSDGEGWLAVQRIGELVDTIAFQANYLTFNGFDVMVARPHAGSPFLDVLAGGIPYQLVTTAEPLGGGGGTSLTVTDGTHTIASVAQISFSGATVGGTSPNATVTIPAVQGPQGIPGINGLDGEPGEDGLPGVPGQNSSSLIQQRGASWSNGVRTVVLPTNDVPIIIAEDCFITDITILTEGGPGSCSIDIWAAPFGTTPTVGNSIVSGTSYPQINAGTEYRDTTLSGITNTSLSKATNVVFHLNSSSVFTTVVILMSLQRVGAAPAGGYTNLQAQNAVASILTSGGTNITWAYVAGTSIKANYNIGAFLTATNGYRTNPDGTITQWGIVANGGLGLTAVAFPISFPNQCMNLVSQCVNVQGTVSQFNVTALGFNSLNGASGSSTYWHAEGF